MKHIANILTSGRILMSAVLIFVPCPSGVFYMLYILCGVTDMLDGAAARLTGSESRFGARLDSIADVFFVLVCALRLLPLLELSTPLLIAAGVIAAVKCVNFALLRRKRLSPELLHSKLSKLTGLLLFLLPLTRTFVSLRLSAPVVTLFAAASAAYEAYIGNTA